MQDWMLAAGIAWGPQARVPRESAEGIGERARRRPLTARTAGNPWTKSIQMSEYFMHRLLPMLKSSEASVHPS